jgi:phosphatidylglycerophosphate synthase
MVFQGDKKEGRSVLGWLDKAVASWALPRIPGWIETYHLTYMTLLWSGGIIAFSLAARWTDDWNWLWGFSAMILLQYITDLLDGKLGKKKDTGLIRWGYYMDHFLDYIFLCSILIGYSLILEDRFKYLLFFILTVFAGYMVNSYLSFAATGRFKISYLGIGPTEIRFLFIIINTLLTMLGKTYLSGALPYVLVLSSLGLGIVVFRTQKRIWSIDMAEKKKKKERKIKR